MVQQAGLSDTGENLSDVRQRLMELNNIDERAQVSFCLVPSLNMLNTILHVNLYCAI